MPQVRVMLVDDSILFIGAMKAAIAKDPDIVVCGTALNGQDALDSVGKMRPDVIVCDVQMPKMSGIDFLKRLLTQAPVPVVVISGTPGITFTALSAGAVDFIPKPGPNEPRGEFFNRLLTTVKTAAGSNIKAKMAVGGVMKMHRVSSLSRTPQDSIVAIGASTGGTDAILAVVRDLPANFPATVITQHMPAGFTSMYAERLNRECKMRVAEAKDGMRLEAGLMILAAGENQMRVKKDTQGYYIQSRPGEKVNGHCPSVEVLFDSVAELKPRNAIGVILTGMGGDGAEGLLHMRQAGAFTIGQDKESSVVYGMPMVAFNRGAVVRQLPLDKINEELVRQVSTQR